MPSIDQTRQMSRALTFSVTSSSGFALLSRDLVLFPKIDLVAPGFVDTEVAAGAFDLVAAEPLPADLDDSPSCFQEVDQRGHSKEYVGVPSCLFDGSHVKATGHATEHLGIVVVVSLSQSQGGWEVLSWVLKEEEKRQSLLAPDSSSDS